MLAIERERVSETADRRSIDRYTLKNDNGVQASIITLGATLVSFLTPDRRGIFADIVLGFDALSDYLSEHPYFGSLIGRYANRIARASFSIADKNYFLVANDGRNHLHGGRVGFDKRLWSARSELSPHGAQVALEYFSPAGEEGYPGNLWAQVIYTLTERNELRLEYHARSDAETFVNLTNHSYFNLAGRGTIDDHVLSLAAPRYLPIDDELIPTGEQRNVDGTAFDFLRPRSIASRMASSDAQLRFAGGYDHCWILSHESGACALAAELHEPVSGRLLKIYTTQPGIQFYSGNFLDGTIRGKGGSRYEQHSGLCLETQHFPDSPHHANFPTTLLKPGDAYKETTVYSFAVKE